MPAKSPSSAFVVTAPREPVAPLVFDSPHSGFEFPADFLPAATREEIQTTWDAYVDELCDGVTAAGASLIAARFPRAYIDANRSARDIDPEILDAAWPEPTELSEHAQRGMGLIRRLALPGVPMYRRKLGVDEVRRRIELYHAPYRRVLAETIERTRQRHGIAWHFNCHSMKSRGNAMNRDRGAMRPDFVIGDRGGETAPPRVTAWVAEFFSRRGYRVTINDPYRGADIVKAHGDPARGVCSIQIEINRALYMDEATCVRNSGFAQVRAELAELARAAAVQVSSMAPRKVSS